MSEPGRTDDALCERLAAAVPDDASVVVQVGRGPGWLGPLLRRRRPDRVVHGVEGPRRRHRADGPDSVVEIDVEHEPLPFPPGTVDAIVYADALPRWRDPLTTLGRHRPALSSTGTVLCSLPNLQHHDIVTQLLRGDFHYADGGPLDPSFVHLFTATGVVQLLLDAGYVPDVTDRLDDPPPPDGSPASGSGAGFGPDAMVSAGAPLLEMLGVGANDARRDLATRWLVVRGVAQEPVEPADEIPLTVVACVNDDAQLHANLLRSPWLGPGTAHEVLLFRDRTSAAEGLNAGIERARNELVVLVHQDVYLPAQWPARLARQWRRAAAGGGPVGIVGVFGVQDRRIAFDATGHVVHRDRRLHHKTLPCDADGLDELLMVVPRHTPLRADPDLGWHLYGTDLALQAQERGLRAVVVDAPCHHNSLTGRVPFQYRHSERVLARKWASKLPIHTNLSSIDTWLLDAAAPPEPAAGGVASEDDDGAPTGTPAGVAELVSRLRREQAALHTELEQARLQVASMRASPFWRARQLYAGVRDRLIRRR